MIAPEDRIDRLAERADSTRQGVEWYLMSDERSSLVFPTHREALEYCAALSPDRIRALTRVVRCARALNDVAFDDDLDAALYDLDILWKEEQA